MIGNDMCALFFLQALDLPVVVLLHLGGSHRQPWKHHIPSVGTVNVFDDSIARKLTVSLTCAKVFSAAIERHRGETTMKITDQKTIDFLRKLNNANDRGRAADKRIPIIKWAIIVKPSSKPCGN